MAISSNLAQLLWTHRRCACDCFEMFGHFSKTVQIVGLIFPGCFE
jgi:hypothetical protein